jgi:hypothetical protein
LHPANVTLKIIFLLIDFVIEVLLEFAQHFQVRMGVKALDAAKIIRKKAA